MSKVKVTSKWDILKSVENFIDSRTANELGGTIVDEAKQMISEGQSPVRGYGRFERYKHPESYPGKRKDSRPVNLELSGAMLRGYDYKIGQGQDPPITVGMVSGTARDKEIASYHQEGTPDMAQRKIVPDAGEEWAVTIMRKISDIWQNRLFQLIRQSNRK